MNNVCDTTIRSEQFSISRNKGEKNCDNGRKLAEMCQRNNIILVNTVFNIK